VTVGDEVTSQTQAVQSIADISHGVMVIVLVETKFGSAVRKSVIKCSAVAKNRSPPHYTALSSGGPRAARGRGRDDPSGDREETQFASGQGFAR
jgi:hypothetical protein